MNSNINVAVSGLLKKRGRVILLGGESTTAAAVKRGYFHSINQLTGGTFFFNQQQPVKLAGLTARRGRRGPQSHGWVVSVKRVAVCPSPMVTLH